MLGEELLNEVAPADLDVTITRTDDGLAYEHSRLDQNLRRLLITAPMAIMMFAWIVVVPTPAPRFMPIGACALTLLSALLLVQTMTDRCILIASPGLIRVRQRILGVWFDRSIDMNESRLALYDFWIRTQKLYGLRVVGQRRRKLPIWGLRKEMEIVGSAFANEIKRGERAPSIAASA